MADFDPTMTETHKPGYKTLAFWATLALTTATAASASGVIDSSWGSQVFAFFITSVTAAGYTVWRDFKKSELPSKPAWKTTEFWLTAAAALCSAAYASGFLANGSLAEKVVAGFVSVLAAMGYAVKAK